MPIAAFDWRNDRQPFRRTFPKGRVGEAGTKPSLTLQAADGNGSRVRTRLESWGSKSSRGTCSNCNCGRYRKNLFHDILALTVCASDSAEV
jgi:hypothetical protein